MTTVFEQYRHRSIKYSELIKVHDWSLKLYTITNKQQFESFGILTNIKKHIPDWLKRIDKSNLDIYKKGFLIVHEAREGVWIILNWWVGGEMIQSEVYFSDFKNPRIISNSPYSSSSLLCVWELEVFAHERAAWIKHILLNAKNPYFDNYLSDVLNND